MPVLTEILDGNIALVTMSGKISNPIILDGVSS